MDQTVDVPPVTAAGGPHAAFSKRPNQGRRALWAALLLAATVAAGLSLVLTRKPPIRYTTAPAERGAITRSVIASGTVNPQLTVLVGAYVSGTIQAIYCDFNTKVRVGQICARIDPRPYQTVVEQDAAALGTSRAQLVKDEAALAYATAADRRMRTLLSEDSTSKDAADQARSAHEQAIAQIGLDQATITERAAELEAAKVNLGYTAITSPVDGTVVSRNVTEGQTVAASFQTPTLFLIATDLRRMQVDANVSEGDVGGGMREGDPATFTVDAFPQRTFQAKVTQIRQSPQTVQNVVTYDVVLTVDNHDLALMPGMTATARITVDHRAGVLRVPNEALRYRPGGLVARKAGGVPTGGAPGARVWVLRDGKPARVRVTTGLADDANTEITGGALTAGDLVITSETKGMTSAAASAAPSFRF